MSTLQLLRFVCLLQILLHIASAQNWWDGSSTGKFYEITLLPEYRPTSGVSIIWRGEDLIDVFYRGPKLQLLHALMTANGVIKKTEDLGGFLLSAPTVSDSTEDAFIVSYVTKQQKVVYRRKPHLEQPWTDEVFANIRSNHAPKLFFDYDKGKMHLYVTAPNTQLTDAIIVNGTITTRFPRKVRGVFTNGSPEIVTSYGVTFFEEFPKTQTTYFYKNHRNDVITNYFGSFRREPKIPKLSDDFCVANLGEGGIIVLGRGFYRNVEAIFYFESDVDRRSWLNAPVITGKPGCAYGWNSCTMIVVTSGDKMSYTQYCN